MKKLLALKLFLIPFAIVLIIFGTIYGTVQQSQRQGANDPQIQMAEDTASAIDQGKAPASLVGPTVHPDASLAPFVIIYDGAGKVLASGVVLNDQTPNLPDGVLTSAKAGLFNLLNHGDYRALTWQPRSDVRIAAVIVKDRSGYVLAGRSLKEVEKRESQSTILTGLGWLLSILGLGAFSGIRLFLRR